MTEQQPLPAAEATSQAEILQNRGRAARAWEQFKDNAHYLGLSAAGLLAIVLPGDIPNRLPAVPDYVPPADNPHALFLEPVEARATIASPIKRPPVVAYVAPVRTPENAAAIVEATQVPVPPEASIATPEALFFDPIERFTLQGLSFAEGSTITITLSETTSNLAGLEGMPSFDLDTVPLFNREEFENTFASQKDYRSNPNQATVYAGVNGSLVLAGHSYYLDGKALPLDWTRNLESALGNIVYVNGEDTNGNSIQLPARISFVAKVAEEVVDGAYRSPEAIDDSLLLMDTTVFDPDNTSELYTMACEDPRGDGTFASRVIVGYQLLSSAPEMMPTQ
jgi:hypothetical protein